jgi:transglutaminase-like putative cysteine protease
MGRHWRARLTCAAVVGSFLLGVAMRGAVASESEGLFPAHSTVVLLVGVPGDVESEENYRAQLQGWLEAVAGGRQAFRVFVLCDDPTNQLAVSSNQLSTTVLKGDRTNFLSLGQTLGGTTNPLVVIAWGHGGKQGSKAVFHVRGPRITASDFKEVAEKAAPGQSRWVLMFRGSGAFAAELAGERRQIISSEGETTFSDDPVGMALLLKIARDNYQLPFTEVAEELGKATEAWYAERHLARTEEPALWINLDKPRPLAVPLAEGNALASAAPAEAKDAETNSVTPAEPPATTTTNALTAVWKEIKRVEARNYPDADAVILRRRLSYTLGSSPAIATEQEEFVQILTPEGKSYGDFDISYSPPHEDIAFDDCEVLRADGMLVRLDPEAIRSSHEQAVGDYSRGQRKFFSLPGVGPGAVLHVRYRTTWKTFPLPHVSLEVPIRQDLAALEETIQVSVPKQTPFHFALEQITAPDPVITQTSYATTYAWRFENLSARRRELLAPPGQRAMLLLSTFPDWAAFADWYGRISKLTDEVTPEIAATAKSLTRDAQGERDKVLALYNYVTRLRYVAVPLGVNSYRPHAAANVLKNEYGDCKDKANLFNALLHSLDIKAHLVLVPRFTQAHEELPGLAFNHAISRVTLGDETLWVDTTDDVCRFGMLPPGDPGRKVLVIGGQTNALTQLPLPDPRDHRLKLRGEVDCTGPADALPVHLSAVASGFPDYELRNAAQSTKEHAQTLPVLAVKLRPTAGLFALESQKSSSVAALTEDFTWQATGTCVGLLARAGDRSLLRAPFWLPGEWGLALHSRKSPLYLNQGYPLTLEEEFEFALPPGAQPPVLPGVSENTVAPLRWRIEWAKLGDDKVVARMRAELARGELSPAETPVAQKQLRQLLAALESGASLPARP